MKNAAPEALQIPCSIGGGDPLALEFVMVDYVGHLKHHIAHILEDGQ
jgi:hypothetical protein